MRPKLNRSRSYLNCRSKQASKRVSARNKYVTSEPLSCGLFYFSFASIFLLNLITDERHLPLYNIKNCHISLHLHDIRLWEQIQQLIISSLRYPNTIISFSTTTPTKEEEEKLSKRIIDAIQVLTNCCLNTNTRVDSCEQPKGKKASEEWRVKWDKYDELQNTHESKNSYLYMTLSTATHIRISYCGAHSQFSIFDLNANKPKFLFPFVSGFSFLRKQVLFETRRNTFECEDRRETHTQSLEMQTDRVLVSTHSVDVKCLLTLSIIISYALGKLDSIIADNALWHSRTAEQNEFVWHKYYLALAQNLMHSIATCATIRLSNFLRLHAVTIAHTEGWREATIERIV